MVVQTRFKPELEEIQNSSKKFKIIPNKFKIMSKKFKTVPKCFKISTWKFQNLCRKIQRFNFYYKARNEALKLKFCFTGVVKTW